jgi:hypothetical protein
LLYAIFNMKNFVDTLILSFTSQEYREFKYFLLRRSDSLESKKNIQLVESIRNNTSLAEKSSNAVYQIKKGLKKQLEQFAILKNCYYDRSMEISSHIDIAKYLFHKNLYDEAWSYLAKAEKLAEDYGEFKLLDQILDLQISYSFDIAVPSGNKIVVSNLLKKRANNKLKEQKQSDRNAAYYELIHEIRDILSQDLTIDIEELKERIFKKYSLTDGICRHELGNIQGYCAYVNITMITLREKKDYSTLKEYGINNYNTLHSKQILDNVPKEFLHNLLDNICISTIRTKDYDVYEKFIALYAAHTTKMQTGSHEKNYYDFIKYVDLADLYLFTNRYTLARESLLEAKKQYLHVQSTRIFYLLRLNLITIHFIEKEYRECIKLYEEMMMFDEKKFLNELYFRLEYLLMIDITAVILHMEDGDNYYALYLLNQLKRKYAKVLRTKGSAREFAFIKFLQKILKDPSYTKSKEFPPDAEEFIEITPYIPGDWELISYNAWVASKVNHKNYYECLCEEIKK